MKDGKPIDRRKVLLYALGGVTGVSAATIGGLEWSERRKRTSKEAPAIEDRPGMTDPHARVTERRRLGKTNLQVSPVGIGAGGLDGPDPIARAVDLGMNYIDTSTCYSRSEETIGRALEQNPGLRDKLIIATKWDPGRATRKADMLASLDQSLKRMGTDRVDVMQLHWLGGGHVPSDDGYNRLANAEIYAAMEEAKRSGKVRFFGATSHDGKRSPILKHAIDKGFEMILVKMNVLDHEGAEIPELLAHAKKHDVGVVVMKSQPGGGRVPAGYEKSRYSIFQANLRWVLSHDEVHCVVHSWIGSKPEAQDLAVGAVQEKLGALERELLEEYAAALSSDYCRECGPTAGRSDESCVDVCPAGVAIPHVAHLAMYDRDYGWHAYARALYQEMPARERWSSFCTSCNRCTEACPFGVDAAGRVRAAKLSLG